ncbi:MAG: hypothetical protein AB8G11_08650 [Saprospiraceae bacterium]
MSIKLLLSISLFSFIWLTACSQNPRNYVEIDALDEEPVKAKYSTQHAYGGWYCPDNLRGFPAIDVQKLEDIPIINGRLPTKEETRNGISLMFFDTTYLKYVRPLDMIMPRLARYYNEHSKKNEIIIVIQTAVIKQDTIVGFRYLNGGNGSAWFGEVAFLTNDEIKNLGATPFISLESNINASSDKVWNIITNPMYAKALGQLFEDNAFLNISKNKKPTVHYRYAPENSSKEGIVTITWENVYIQIDYNFEGKHYVQKFLISENQTTNNSHIHIVSGPYDDDLEAQTEIWKNWLEKVKIFSEGL